MRVALISAGLGGFTVPGHAPRDPSVAYFPFTDENFPPRVSSLTSRLQARIPKMFGWQLHPGFDFYVWLDASFCLSSRDSIQWFLGCLGDKQMGLFLHPERQTVREEADYIQTQVARGNRYLTRRYLAEDVAGHLALLDALSYPDERLYATGALIYRSTPEVQAVMWRWWAYTSRYHSVDQLSLPVALWQEGVEPAILPGDIFNCPAFAFEAHR